MFESGRDSVGLWTIESVLESHTVCESLESCPKSESGWKRPSYERRKHANRGPPLGGGRCQRVELVDDWRTSPHVPSASSAPTHVVRAREREMGSLSLSYRERERESIWWCARRSNARDSDLKLLTQVELVPVSGVEEASHSLFLAVVRAPANETVRVHGLDALVHDLPLDADADRSDRVCRVYAGTSGKRARVLSLSLSRTVLRTPRGGRRSDHLSLSLSRGGSHRLDDRHDRSRLWTTTRG